MHDVIILGVLHFLFLLVSDAEHQLLVTGHFCVLSDKGLSKSFEGFEKCYLSLHCVTSAISYSTRILGKRLLLCFSYSVSFTLYCSLR